jgi:hypothetical protein
MLVCVTFYVGMREVWMLLGWFAVEEILREEAPFPLYLLLLSWEAASVSDVINFGLPLAIIMSGFRFWK